MKLLILGMLLPFWNGANFDQEFDTLLINHVNVISMESKRVLEDQDVLIANGKILSIQETSENQSSDSYQVVDGTGKYMVPGFHEMHFHWRNQDGGIERDLNLFIANGVTTVQEFLPN